MLKGMALMQGRLGTVRGGQTTLRSAGARRGVVWVTVALALVALMGAAALTIDLGRRALAIQRTQEVADAAAMAAAGQLPDTSSASVRLAQVASANNEANPWPQITINSDADVTYYAPGDEVPDYGVLESDECAVAVTAHANAEYGFGKVAGLDEMQLTRQATALVRPGGTSTCIFANDENEHALIFPADGLQVSGFVHSNGGIDINGMNAVFNDLVEYFNVLRDPSGTTTYKRGIRKWDKRDWPIDYIADDFAPYDVVIEGDWDLKTDNVTLAPGNYFVNGDVIIRGNNLIAEDCTIVATGSIYFRGLNPKMTPHDKDVALYSLTGDIIATADGTELDGIVFAPLGHIDYLGNGQRVVSLLADTISFHGDDVSITAVAGLYLLGRVRLIK